MNDLDRKIKTVVRAIGESSPSAPELRKPDVKIRPRRVVHPGEAALTGFIVVAAFFAVFALFRGTDPAVLTGQVEVVHQVLTYRLEFDLPCEGGAEQQSGGFNEMSIDSWADVTGSRFRQQTTYPDGSTRDVVALGHPSLPQEAWSRGEARGNQVQCVGGASTGVLGYDPTDGIGVMIFNSPVGSPGEQGYLELGTRQTGDHIDSMGRATDLYLLEVNGFIGEGESRPIHQTTAWHVEPSTGDVLEVAFRTFMEGIADVSRVTTFESEERVSVNDDHFDTAGYTLSWSEADDSEGRVEGTEVEPFTSLGAEWIWPLLPEPGVATDLGERFADEVLGWELLATTMDADAGRSRVPTWMNLVAQDHSLRVLAIPSGGGWVLIQIGEGGMVLHVGAGATPNLAVTQFEGAVTSIVLVAEESSTRAWHFDLDLDASDMSLPGLIYDDIRTALVVYYDTEGQVVGAVGGQY